MSSKVRAVQDEIRDTADNGCDDQTYRDGADVALPDEFEGVAESDKCFRVRQNIGEALPYKGCRQSNEIGRAHV